MYKKDNSECSEGVQKDIKMYPNDQNGMIYNPNVSFKHIILLLICIYMIL